MSQTNISGLDLTRHFVTFTHHTSAEYIFPFTLCSDPSLSLSPQWKWNCSNLYFFANGPPDNSTIKDTTAHFIVFVFRSPSLSRVFSRLSTWLSHKKACAEISAETSMQRSKKLFIAEILRTGSRRCSVSDIKEFADDWDKHTYATAHLSEFRWAT